MYIISLDKLGDNEHVNLLLLMDFWVWINISLSFEGIVTEYGTFTSIFCSKNILRNSIFNFCLNLKSLMVI